MTRGVHGGTTARQRVHYTSLYLAELELIDKAKNIVNTSTVIVIA
jgi:hypothetical protein